MHLIWPPLANKHCQSTRATWQYPQQTEQTKVSEAAILDLKFDPGLPVKGQDFSNDIKTGLKYSTPLNTGKLAQH